MKRNTSFDPEDYVQHILDEIEILLEIKKRVNEKDFYKDEFLKRTAVRCFEIMGEATKKLSNEVRVSNPHIEWKDIAGMRDVMIHDYFFVDYEIIWQTINNQVPQLKKKLKKFKKNLSNV